MCVHGGLFSGEIDLIKKEEREKEGGTCSDAIEGKRKKQRGRQA